MLSKLQVFQNTSPKTVRLEVLVSQEFTNKSKQPKHVKLRDLYHFTVPWQILLTFSILTCTQQQQRAFGKLNTAKQKHLSICCLKNYKLDCKLNQFDARLYNN